MPLYQRKQKAKGFTLIELLVVVSIISLLSSIIFSSINSARGKARDSFRRQALIQLRNALELYRLDNGHYPWHPDPTNSSAPSQARFCNSDTRNTGTAYDSSCNNTNYVPGLVPKYISQLPQEPNPGLYTMSFTGSGCPTGTSYSSFQYSVNRTGTEYVLNSWCAVENPISSSDSMSSTYPDILQICSAGTVSASDLHCANGGSPFQW